MMLYISKAIHRDFVQVGGCGALSFTSNAWIPAPRAQPWKRIPGGGGTSALRVEKEAGSVCSDGSSCLPGGPAGEGTAASELPRGFQRYAGQRGMRQEAMAVNIRPGRTGWREAPGDVSRRYYTHGVTRKEVIRSGGPGFDARKVNVLSLSDHRTYQAEQGVGGLPPGSAEADQEEGPCKGREPCKNREGGLCR
jgi:hypothetical protein